MERTESVAAWKRPIPISFILLTAVVVHVPLLLAKLPLQSYDATFHIFFASHYVHHWFDPWNVKWYAGFSQTTYPPLPQQWVAVLSHIFGLEMAYMAVQFAAILLLVVGVYRFSLLWVSERAASFAALASVFLGAESFLVYAAGQLSTTSAAPIYLNALPYLFDWVRSWQVAIVSEGRACCSRPLPRPTTPRCSSDRFSLHVPVLALVILDRQGGERISTPAFVARTVIIVHGGRRCDCNRALLPFWIALIHNPGHPGSNSSCQPSELHPEPLAGPQLLRDSLRSLDSGPAVHLAARFDGGAAPSACCLASGWHSWWESAEQPR